MSCLELQEMFELYALGVLEPAEKEEIDAHPTRLKDMRQEKQRSATWGEVKNQYEKNGDPAQAI